MQCCSLLVLEARHPTRRVPRVPSRCMRCACFLIGFAFCLCSCLCCCSLRVAASHWACVLRGGSSASAVLFAVCCLYAVRTRLMLLMMMLLTFDFFFLFFDNISIFLF